MKKRWNEIVVEFEKIVFGFSYDFFFVVNLNF